MDYAPPALTSRYLRHHTTNIPEQRPWWAQDDDRESGDVDQKALVRVRTHAEDLAALTTPKV